MTNFLEGIPDILYKYRTWDNQYHKNLLLKQELYFASSEQFNDPFDCSLPFIIDEHQLTEEQIFQKYYDMTISLYPEKSTEEIHKIVYREHKENRLHDQNHLKEIAELQREKIEKEIGILSLSEDEDNFLMWSHYTNSHRGYCVGFDKFTLYDISQGIIGNINYSDSFPKYNLFGNELDLINNLYTKATFWEYENEYRITKIGLAKKIINFPKEGVKEIIFGCKMEHATKLELLKSIEEIFPTSRVFEMQLNEKEFKLNKFPLR